MCAGRSQFTRNHISRNFRPNQQDALPVYSPAQAEYHGFRDILLRNNIHPQASFFDCLPGRRPDRRNVQVLQLFPRNPKFLQPFPHRVHAIHAGQDQPVVVTKIFQGTVKGLERLRLPDFNEGNLEYLRAQFAQPGR